MTGSPLENPKVRIQGISSQENGGAKRFFFSGFPSSFGTCNKMFMAMVQFLSVLNPVVPQHVPFLRKKLYIWRHQPKIRAVPIQSPFAMYSTVQPRPPVCRSQRLSAAIRQWGMAGHCEIKFYRPDDGRKTVDLDPLICSRFVDVVMFCSWGMPQDDVKTDFGVHFGVLFFRPINLFYGLIIFDPIPQCDQISMFDWLMIDRCDLATHELQLGGS